MPVLSHSADQAFANLRRSPRGLQAEDAFRGAAELEPGNAAYQARLAHAVIGNRKHQEAESVALRAVAASPDDERLKTVLAARRPAEALALPKREGVLANGWRRLKAPFDLLARA